MEYVIAKKQIDSNLRRTASEGLISLLSHKQLNDLALKYYGVYREGMLVGYECPYSGKILTDLNDIVLEHIIPVSSNGGTVLFNCIPTSKHVNGVDEKGARHLISWWKQKKYYSSDKLDKLLSYVFDAYDTVFKEYTIEEVEKSYNDVESKNKENSSYADLNTTSKEQAKELKKQAEYTGIISYLGFINDCMLELKNNGYDITKYQEKLKKYEQNNIFKEIDKYTLIQEILRKLIITKLDSDNRSELTYILNIDISKLMNSVGEFETAEQLFNELSTRINNIESILLNNEISILSFFEDIKNQEILYKKISQINNSDIEQLINDITLCTNDKFNRLIEWYQNNADFRYNIGYNHNLWTFLINVCQVSPRKNGYAFNTKLNREQLKFLNMSNDPRIKIIYLKIIQKSIQYKIPIEYDDIELREFFEEYYKEYNTFSDNPFDDLPLAEQKKLFDDGLYDSNFINLLNWYENETNIAKKQPSSDDKNGKYLSKIKSVSRINNGYGFHTNLSPCQLKYLHDSNDIRLRNIYMSILQKSIQYKIPIGYDDIELRTKYEQYYSIYGTFSNNPVADLPIEEQKEVYKNNDVYKSNFIALIEWYEDNLYSFQPKEGYIFNNIDLGYFLMGIKNVAKGKEGYHFNTNLSTQQLKYLHDSNDIRLRSIYMSILQKSIQYKIPISYDDIELRTKYEQYYSIYGTFSNDPIADLSIEEQKEIYKNNDVYKSNFIALIEWYEDCNNLYKTQPKQKEKISGRDLGTFLTGIKTAVEGKNGYYFQTNLSSKQLKYLHDSKDIRLKSIYMSRLQKSIQYKIPIGYDDIELRTKYEQHFNVYGTFSNDPIADLSIEEQKELYSMDEIHKSNFIALIEWFENNEQNQPKQREKINGRDLGVYLNTLKQVNLNKTGYHFAINLSPIQLKYLYESTDSRLQKIYFDILDKALKYNLPIAYYPDNLKEDNYVRRSL